MATLFGLLLRTMLPEQRAGNERMTNAAETLLLGVPLLTAAWCAFLGSPGHARLGRGLRRALRALGRVPLPSAARGQRGSGHRTLDLRGASLGLLAGLAALGLAGLNLLQPLQTAWLSGLIQTHNEVVEWSLHVREVSGLGPPRPPAAPGSPRNASSPSRGTVPAFAAAGVTADIVLLDMDAETLRSMRRRRDSEAGVQARAVRRLSAWGARAIVLPLPLLSEHAVRGAFSDPAAAAFGPMPGKDEAARSRRDVPALVEAIRAAGKRVVLAVPAARRARAGEGEEQQDKQNRVAAAAAAANEARLRAAAMAEGQVGQADLGRLPGSVRLPVIPTRWPAFQPPPVPLVLAQLARSDGSRGGASSRQSPRPQPAPTDSADQIVVAGAPMPLIDRDAILVDFRHHRRSRRRAAAGPRANSSPAPFLRADYASVLQADSANEANDKNANGAAASVVWVPASSGGGNSGAGNWQPPRAFFRDKIVFLDTLAPRAEITPLGPADQREVLAHATATLLSPAPLHRLDGAALAALTLVFAVLAGHLSVRRAPLDALWRVALPLCLLLVVAALRVFPGIGSDDGGLWIDPVLPFVGAIGAFLLATQLTWGMDRDEREFRGQLLRRFLAPQVAAELLDGDPDSALGLGGRRQQVCVLFADVRNFSQFAETHTPEQVIEAINSYMTALTHALYDHRGLLDKYTGDGLMALFRPQEDGDSRARPGSSDDKDARRVLVERAVRAALAMRDAARDLSVQRVRENKNPLEIGIGLHFGEAVCGLVGNPVHQINYTALGHTVVVSARLQATAGGGEVVVSEDVYQTVADLFSMEARDPVSVKGVSAPVRPYRVLAAAPSPLSPRPQRARGA
jgi:class 3 adenylate cyclase